MVDSECDICYKTLERPEKILIIEKQTVQIPDSVKKLKLNGTYCEECFREILNNMSLDDVYIFSKYYSVYYCSYMGSILKLINSKLVQYVDQLKK